MPKLLALRSGLEITRIAPREFVLRDPITGEAFRLGERERFLLDQLDGTRDTAEIARRHQERFGEPISAEYLEGFLGQVTAAGLCGDPATVPSGVKVATVRRGLRLTSPPIAPLSAADPHAALNGFFDLLALACGWILHPAWLVPLGGLTLLGATTLYQKFDRYSQEIVGLANDTEFWQRIPVFFLMVLLAVSLPRALLLGMACRAFGGRVRHFGPRLERRLLPYIDCDIGDSLARLEPGQQWALLTLGIWSQFLVGGLSLLLWAMSEPGSGVSHFCLLVIPHCVLGVLLRFNVLARTDAYAMLCHWTGEPRLAERAKLEVARWLGAAPPTEALTPRQRFWFRRYGLGLFLWKATVTVVVVVGGGWLLIDQLHGTGAVVGAVALSLWYADEARSKFMSIPAWRWLVRAGGRWYIRWPVRLMVLAGLIACGWIPYSHEVGGDFRLIPVAEVGIRAPISGTLTTVPHGEGEAVAQGDTLAVIDPREQRAQLEATRHELEEAQANLDLARAGNRAEEVEAARQKMELASVRLKYYEQELVRVEGLATTNTVSPAQLETARFDRDSAHRIFLASREELAALEAGSRPEAIRAAEADVARLASLVDHYTQEVSLATVTAPLAGRLTTTNVRTRAGTFVQQGDLIAVVQDTARMRAEIAATEEAAAAVQAGQVVHLRMWGLHGDLVTARVVSKTATAIDARKWDQERVRSDREAMVESAHVHDQRRNVWVYAELDASRTDLVPEMTGKARITIGPDLLWRALARPVLRFFRVEVWSWLP